MLISSIVFFNTLHSHSPTRKSHSRELKNLHFKVFTACNRIIHAFFSFVFTFSNLTFEKDNQKM